MESVLLLFDIDGMLLEGTLRLALRDLGVGPSR